MNSFAKAGFVLIGAVVTIGVVAVPFISRGQSGGNVERGHEIAAENCARCHSITPGSASPVADAPAFETLSQKWPLEHLEEALAEGIMVGHEEFQMPVFQFTPDEVSDLIAFLQSIQTPPTNDNQ